MLMDCVADHSLEHDGIESAFLEIIRRPCRLCGAVYLRFALAGQQNDRNFLDLGHGLSAQSAFGFGVPGTCASAAITYCGSTAITFM